MNYTDLIRQRDQLVRQAWLANLSFAHHRLGDFGARIARAHLHGEVVLSVADPSTDHPWPALEAREGSQAVIEEHFLDRDIAELADILVFLSEDHGVTEFTFRLEDLETRFLPPVRRALEEAGVDPGATTRSPEDSNRGQP